jgi:basic amino acid/polyamine antiporter, APA family
VLLLWTGSFESIVIYAGVGLALFSMLAVGSIYVLRRTRPDLPRPFRTPGYPIVPAIFLAGTALLTLAAFLERPMVSLASLLSILAGMPVYYLWVRPRSRMARGRTQTPYVVSHSHLMTIDCVDA